MSETIRPTPQDAFPPKRQEEAMQAGDSSPPPTAPLEVTAADATGSDISTEEHAGNESTTHAQTARGGHASWR